MSEVIHHLVAAAEFHAIQAGAAYLPAAFAQDGFIHCTEAADMLLYVANQFYRSQPGEFLVLVIDPTRLAAPLRYEPPIPTPPAGSLLAGALLPHIYGPLNRDAIIQVRRAERAADGTFTKV